MTAVCPKCSYRRTAADSGVPDWQCPSCGIAYAKYADGAPPVPRAVPAGSARDASVSLIAAGCVLAGLAAFGYYAYDSHAKRKLAPAEAGARPPSTFVEGERLEASNPAFYGTMERGAPVLRMTPATAAALAKTTSSAQVVMFATASCPYCAKARAVFKKRGVRYTELDIESDEQAKNFLEQVMGMSGYPTIVIGNRVTLGFNEEQIELSLKEL